MPNTKSFRRLWGFPLLIFVMIFCGLVVALNGDGIWNMLSWILLGIPIFISIKYYFK